MPTCMSISRPFLLSRSEEAFVNACLAAQTEWTPARQGREGRSLTRQAAAPTASEAREAMKEKVLGLSLSYGHVINAGK